MGNPLSGTLAEIFITNLEEKFILNQLNNSKKHITYWYRYVDDILILFTGTTRQLKILHNYINNLHPNIKFTLETEDNNQINFLDITITKNNNNHNFKVYRKPTQTNHTIHHTSNHPQQHKTAAYHHMINRLNNIPMNNTDYKNEIQIIKHIATSNGYKDKMIDDMNDRFRRKEYLRSLTTLITERVNNHKYITLEYDTTTFNITRRIFTQYEYKTAYKTSNKLERLINTNKAYNEYQSGVYKLKCDDCDMFYIGQTGRNFTTRFVEHMKQIGKPNITSNFAQHLTQKHHNCSSFDNNVEILHRMPKGEKLNRAEELEIYNYRGNPKLLNDRMPFNAIYELIINRANLQH